MQLLLLASAICSEVAATLSLRMATVGSKRWYVPVTGGYLFAFMLLAVVLDLGMPLGIAYGIWTATGVALTAILSRILFNESLTWLMGIGITLIVGGVLLVEVGAVH